MMSAVSSTCVQVVHGHGDLAELDLLAFAAAGARGDHQVADARAERRQRNVDVEVVVLRRQAAADAARGRLRLGLADDRRRTPCRSA